MLPYIAYMDPMGMFIDFSGMVDALPLKINWLVTRCIYTHTHQNEKDVDFP